MCSLATHKFEPAGLDEVMGEIEWVDHVSPERQVQKQPVDASASHSDTPNSNVPTSLPRVITSLVVNQSNISLPFANSPLSKPLNKVYTEYQLGLCTFLVLRGNTLQRHN